MKRAISLSSAQTLHGWLVGPLQQDLQGAGIHTLVMVADGSLRTIPMGALHDGRHFLVDSLAVGVTPSLALTDLSAAHRRKGSLLSVGLTESVEGLSAPRYAETEVQAIRTLYGGKLLMNKQFSAPSLEEEIKDQGVGIVADVLPRIFDQFYRVAETAHAVPGLGLGLHVSKTLPAWRA